MTARVSIFISTRDRASYIRETLAALARVKVPTDLPTELVVIDNGSRDDTADVVRAAPVGKLPVRLVSDPEPGKCAALNRAMAVAAGEILLHTDDDVRPPRTWVEDMCRPIAHGVAAAVAGGVRMAPHLRRDWMTGLHREWLLEYDFTGRTESGVMIGANMAFHRRVLHRVGGFDPDLGPGAMGYSDDVLFSWMIQRAGFKILACRGEPVEHHFDPSRLMRDCFLARAVTEGRLAAYLAHHWLHARPRFATLRAITARVAAWAARSVVGAGHDREGCPEWALRRIMAAEYWASMRRDRGRRPHYDADGLTKLSGRRVPSVEAPTAA